MSQANIPFADGMALFADPVRRHTLYAVVGNQQTPPLPTIPELNLRSDDDGVHWTTVARPHGLHSFRIYLDPHLPGRLSGATVDSQVRSTTRWVSSDEGRTWHVVQCPGRLAGSCPRFTVDNVFGAGSSYAFFNSGLYRFHGAGAAESRLALGDHLPVALANIRDVQAGTQAGQPIYLLTRGVRAGVDGLLFRRRDEGRSWQRLSLPLFPSRQPASSAPGALYVAQAHHSVAPAFVASYRTLGVDLLGAPVTEAYSEGGTLTQDFACLRLQLVNGRVIVANLGLVHHWDDGYAYTDPPMEPLLSSAPRRYFRATDHAVAGEFLRFWETHNGPYLLGNPISDVISGQNGDGSGDSYQQQWFEKGRLEWHTDLSQPQPRVVLGPLGTESLYLRGWLPARNRSATLFWDSNDTL